VLGPSLPPPSSDHRSRLAVPAPVPAARQPPAPPSSSPRHPLARFIMAAPSTSSSARLVAASCRPQTGCRQHLMPFPHRAGGGVARWCLACKSRRPLGLPPRWAAGASRRDAASRLAGAIVLSPASSFARQHRHGGGRGLGGRENGAGQLGFHGEAFLSLSCGISSGRIIAGFRQSTDAAHAHPADRVDQTARGAPRSGRRVKPRCSTAFASGQVGTDHCHTGRASGHVLAL
jgi:hypothetical protein